MSDRHSSGRGPARAPGTAAHGIPPARGGVRPGRGYGELARTATQRRMTRDLRVLLAGIAVVFALSAWLDVFEAFGAWARAHESWQLDEILLSAGLLSVPLCVFSFRRWAELRLAELRAQEVAERMKALAAAGAGVIAAQSAEELRGAIHDACAGVIPFDTLLMARYQPEDETLHYLGALDAGVWGDPVQVSVRGRPSERVIRERRSSLIHSSDDPAARGTQLTGTGRRSESIIRTPLLSAGGVVGLLSVQSYRPGEYDAEDVEVLETLAALAAPAFLNLQLLSDLRVARTRAERMAERMAVVAKAAAGVIAAKSLEELRDVLHDACEGLFPFDAFMLAEHHPERGTLAYLAEYDDGVYAPGQEVPVRGPAARVLAERRSLLTLSSADPAGAGGVVSGTGRRSESVIRTPVLGPGGVLGLLVAHSYTPNAYDAHDVEVLETVAALASTAMANIRLLAERGASDEALRESEARYRMLADGTNDVVSLHDAQGTFLYASPSMEKITGLSGEALLGRTTAHLVHPDDLWAVRETHNLTVAGELTEVEWRVRCHDGSYLWMATRSTMLRDEAGEAFRIVCSSRDVTARLRAEEALRESEARFRAVFDDAGIGIILGDAEGNVLEVNPALQRMLGYPAHELRAVGPAALTHPDDLERDRALFAEVLAGRRNQYALEKRYLHRDGHVVWGRLMTSLIRGAAGEPRYVMALVEDVTAQRQAQEALRASEAQLRAMFDEAPIGVALADMRGRTLRSNRALQEMLGYGAHELAGTAFSAFSHPDDVEADWLHFDQLVAGERGEYQLEKRYFRKDGSMLWGRLSVSLVRDAGGEPRYAVGMVENITEHKAAERALEHSQALLLQAQKMEAVGRLAGGVAHDFNNMLTAIRGNAELLLMDTPPDDPRRLDLEEIQHAANRSADLTRQLLAFSRQQVLQPRVLELNQSVAATERMLRRLIGEDIDLATMLDPALGRVTADPGQVEQVLLNLAVNARDAMPQGGKLWIKTANVYLPAGDRRLGPEAAPGPYVAVTVVDTGCGMDDATLARIWEPFFTTKEQGKGTGLGLSTVYGIVRQSGGTVWAESEPDRGTAITTYFPRTDRAACADEAGDGLGAAPVARGTETVLVVEDEAAVRRLTTRVLARSGFRVLEASEPVEALELFRVHGAEVDLVLTDLVMPGMDGIRLAEILRERTPSLPVIFSTGYSAEALHPDRIGPGAEILLKPFSPDALVRKVREVLDA